MQYITALKDFQDETYRVFLQNILKEGLPVLGVRAHDIKMIAKSADIASLFKNIEKDQYHEQRMVRLQLLALTKMDEYTRIELIDKMLPFVDSWALTDSFVSALKSTKKERDLYVPFIQDQSTQEYSYRVRFALVMLNSYFHSHAFLKKSLSIIEGVHRSEKEIVMAKAWAIVTMLSHHPQEAIHWYDKAPIEEIVHRRVVQKARESRVVDKTTVERIGTKKVFI